MDSIASTTKGSPTTRVRERLLALALGVLLALLAPGIALLVLVSPQLRMDWIRPRAEQRYEAILDDLAQGEQEAWWGRYAVTSGYVTHELALSSAGFFFEYDHCTGTGSLAHGAVKVVGEGRIRLDVEAEVEDWRNGGEGALLGETCELVLVTWGVYRFMVPVDGLEAFCEQELEGPYATEAVLAGYLRLDGFELTWASEMPKLAGVPDLPVEFRHLLAQ